ncbi:hypothetical protein SAY87_020853 [Trapa incisa]|uniref:LysM domain-containing protein n=1 Tax=Trapa incisa TaxID=236973 RepID=A0AAN7JQE1_9MYRT|nr:hypothetical protein SAY87_020853 [Trapa incisa]
MASSCHHLLLSSLLLLAVLAPTSLALGFTCNSKGAICQAIAGYSPANATTFSALQKLFAVKHLRSLLGANGLPITTPANSTVAASLAVRIPFNCSCGSNATGASYRRPEYRVRRGDTLSHIASGVFSNLVTFTDIQLANKIRNPNLIAVGKKLWIPLPCSCDDVAGSRVVHYGHVVTAGSSIVAISEQFNVTQETIMTINGIAETKALKAGQVLDIPLKACSSSIRNDSLDASLLVANGTYVFTANNCVRCSCDSANNWTLQCQPSELRPSNWSACPSMQCGGTGLYIGNSSLFGCGRTCTYAGYTSQAILTTTSTDSTCLALSNHAVKNSLLMFCWNSVLVPFLILQILLLFR